MQMRERLRARRLHLTPWATGFHVIASAAHPYQKIQIP
jgi:hypothetical protein